MEEEMEEESEFREYQQQHQQQTRIRKNNKKQTPLHLLGFFTPMSIPLKAT
jgi:hypothetical protein